VDGTSATPECDAGNPVRLFLKTSDRGSWQETQDEETQSGEDLVSSAQRYRKRINLSSFPDHIAGTVFAGAYSPEQMFQGV